MAKARPPFRRIMAFVEVTASRTSKPKASIPTVIKVRLDVGQHGSPIELQIENDINEQMDRRVPERQQTDRGGIEED
ncbi:hypothetical protein IVB30_03505 [Bradyrhizobium sp. 200]|uniref:hypothetical protein n=1 Tax=Bradyrhizobium sp. 200 TaxID=2782665 RepID=UPI001FFF4DA1|nr:hypothetical protein [Bradyrhizobium sp. 200]UPJ50490.1 hypothetical protein IVB30_03505 [Bradyrhizobium sp. 200]